MMGSSGLWTAEAKVWERASGVTSQPIGSEILQGGERII
jgi:hypothetical protein